MARQSVCQYLLATACLLVQTVIPMSLLVQVTAPQAFFAGELDLMATTEDILEQQRRLAPGVHAADYIYQSVSSTRGCRCHEVAGLPCLRNEYSM